MSAGAQVLRLVAEAKGSGSWAVGPGFGLWSGVIERAEVVMGMKAAGVRVLYMVRRVMMGSRKLAHFCVKPQNKGSREDFFMCW